MNIGEAARKSGLSAKTIRYYEEARLVVPERLDNGYRDYAENDVHTLQFLQRARSLGFSMDDCRNLLALYADHNRASADVRALAKNRIAEIDRKIREMQTLRRTLSNLVRACHGDDRPNCPILEDIALEEPRLQQL